jgi:retron-type reverse transcriptase
LIPRIQRLRQRLNSLASQAIQKVCEQAQQAELQQIITRLEEFSAKVKDNLDDADWHTKRDLIRTLVKQVEVSKEDVSIVIRVTPDPFVVNPDRDVLSSNQGSLQHFRGVISPFLANLFMHYAFDEWMRREHKCNPWARFADDAVIHRRTQKEAEALLI